MWEVRWPRPAVRHARGGHTATTEEALLVKVQRLLACAEDLARDALQEAIEDYAVVVEDGMIIRTGAAVMERFLTDQVLVRFHAPGQVSFAAAMSASELIEEIDGLEKNTGHRMTAEQKQAVIAGVRLPFSVLTGGAGSTAFGGPGCRTH